jgi:transcriptional regulator with XRE-family HTH domain/tetratricopeptide (TPR) repeat protein
MTESMSGFAERYRVPGFAAAIRSDRESTGQTQEELAERSGVSVRTIRDLEAGRITRPRPSTLRQIASVIDALQAARAAPSDAGPVGGRGLAQLPGDLRDFTGRDKEVIELEARLEVGPGAAARVAAIVGPGGSGKTALALHVAHCAKASFPDGQLYLTMGGASAQPLSTADALARILRDLGTDPAALPATEDERAAWYRSLVASRRLLIVLDDVRDAAQVRSLVPGSAAAAVLITSRSSLSDMEAASVLQLPGMTAEDALALFTTVVGARRVAAEPDAARMVVAACAGMPLAVRIIAARLRARPGWTIGSLAARLADEGRILDELQVGDLAVRASFMISYAHLRAAKDDSPPQEVFRLLSAAPGPDISLAAAAALLGMPADTAEPVLEQLIDAQLLQSPSAHRYRFHDLLGAFAAERLAAEVPAATTAAATRRLLTWYLYTAAAAGRQLNPHHPHVELKANQCSPEPLSFAGYDDALGWLDLEQANLLAAIGLAASTGEHEITWQLAAVLWDLFDLRGHIGDWLTAHRTGLASARLVGDKRAQMRLLNSVAGNYLYLRDHEAALTCTRELLTISRGLGDRAPTAVALMNLGAILSEAERRSEAAEPLAEALVIFREIGERNGEGFALCNLGAIEAANGDADTAICHLTNGIAVLREIGNLPSAAESLVLLSELRRVEGDLSVAVDTATEAVALSRRSGSRRVEGIALAALGLAHRDRAEVAAARQCWRSAHELLAQLGHPQASVVAGYLDD